MGERLTLMAGSVSIWEYKGKKVNFFLLLLLKTKVFYSREMVLY